MTMTRVVFFAVLALLASLSYADCGGNNQKACHCQPEWYVGGYDCSPHDRCNSGCTQHGSSTLFMGKFWNEATCTCPKPPEPIWSSWTKTPIQSWAEGWDKRYGLDKHMDWKKLNWVTELKQGMTTSVDDGLYIFVFRNTDNKLLIRRSDRPDDIGIFSHGSKRYSYPENPIANGENPMFVRHTQLNGGWTPVWAAGQLEFYHGKIIWVSNASGHYQPRQPPTLDYVATALNEWNIPTINPLQKLVHEWEKNWTLVPDKQDMIAVATMGDMTLLGVGTDNKLYARQPFKKVWQKQADHGGQVTTIAVMQDDTILGIGKDKKLYTRQSLSTSWVKAPDKGGAVIFNIAIMKNGSILGVGTDKKLYTRQNLNSSWVKAPDKGGEVIAVTVMNNGTIIGVGTNHQLYTRATLNAIWKNIPNSGFVVDVTIINDTNITDPNKVQRIIGVGEDYNIWIRLP